MSLHSGSTVSYDIEPFMLYGKHASDSAYPHSKSPLPVSSAISRLYILPGLVVNFRSSVRDPVS